MTDTAISGFFDLQVNGYAGVDFNQDDLMADQLHRACEKLRADGSRRILATIVTEDVDRMARRIANVVRLRDSDPLARDLIAGIHIEGPFLNPETGYRGAHPLDAIIPADAAAMDRLIDAGGGLVRLVTLAPEQDPGCVLMRLLSRRGIVVSAGHCNPSVEEIERALDAGLTLFTHLGNGCPMMLPRHDNIIQRALSFRDRLWLCFIADGVHIPFPALGNYLRCASIARAVVVTDAIAPAGLGPGHYTVSRWNLNIGEDLVARAPDGSHLVGSAVTMQRSAKNLREVIGLSEREVEQLTMLNPALACPVTG